MFHHQRAVITFSTVGRTAVIKRLGSTALVIGSSLTSGLESTFEQHQSRVRNHDLDQVSSTLQVHRIIDTEKDQHLNRIDGRIIYSAL
ncbi:hypothetical protein TNCV_4028421 [Trichonephila clavipes]|nr:hypothetical protein TNCV_4028421 [Trichonephila clavipes]